MATGRRYIDGILSQSAFSQTLSGTTVYNFDKSVYSLRLNLTGVLTPFRLSPFTGNAALPALRAIVVQAQAEPNDSSATAYSMSYAVVTLNSAFGGGSAQITNGFFTGVINGASAENTAPYTAALNPNVGKTIVQPGATCYVTSTNHTGVMAVTLFYKLESY